MKAPLQIYRIIGVGLIPMLGILLTLPLAGQSVVSLQNKGLEAPYQTGFNMPHWAVLRTGDTPDIQPGNWEVVKKPFEGRSFVGLIIREDGSREGIYQELKQPLKGGQCYYLSLALARDPVYAGFNLPISLRISGRYGLGGKIVELAMSPLITHTQWQVYTLEFTPPSDIDQFILQASPGPGISIAYRGNILVDGISDFGRCIRAARNDDDTDSVVY